MRPVTLGPSEVLPFTAAPLSIHQELASYNEAVRLASSRGGPKPDHLEVTRADAAKLSAADLQRGAPILVDDWVVTVGDSDRLVVFRYELYTAAIVGSATSARERAESAVSTLEALRRDGVTVHVDPVREMENGFVVTYFLTAGSRDVEGALMEAQVLREELYS